MFKWLDHKLIEPKLLNNIHVDSQNSVENMPSNNISIFMFFNMSEQIEKTIESNQTLRPYDNVPRKAKAQEIKDIDNVLTDWRYVRPKFLMEIQIS